MSKSVMADFVKDVMRKEIKICLPVYKIVYSVCFVILLSLVRGITYSEETGPAMEGPVAILAFAFCADTYVQEIVSSRIQVLCLCPVKRRAVSLYVRIAVQSVYVILLSAAGYGFFYLFQKPIKMSAELSEAHLFLLFLEAVSVTAVFWGMLSAAVSILCRSLWASAAVCLVLWILAYSKAADLFLGKWNLFSYAFLGAEGNTDWRCGEAVCAAFILMLAAAVLMMIKKR